MMEAMILTSLVVGGDDADVLGVTEASSWMPMSTSSAVIVGILTWILASWLRGSSSAKTCPNTFDNFVKDKDVGKIAGDQLRSTSFEAFLKVSSAGSTSVPQVRATSFEAFLKTPSKDHGKKQPSQTKAAPGTVSDRSSKPKASAEEERVNVLVLYGTEYGFSRELAEKMASKLEESVYRASLLDMKDADLHRDVVSQQCVLVFCSTQGDGVPPPDARRFYEDVHQKSLSQDLLSSTYFSVLALGDSNYTHFCKCGKDFDSRLEELGAKRLFSRGDVDQEDWAVIDRWMDSVMKILSTLALKKAKLSSSGPPAVTSREAKETLYGKQNPFFAALVQKCNLCAGDDAMRDKVTIHYEFSLDPLKESSKTGPCGLEYLPGDALGVYPVNDEDVVQRVLACIKATGNEMLPLPKWHYDRKDADNGISLKEALLRCYELQNLKVSCLSMLTRWSESRGCRDNPLTEILKDGTSSKTNQRLATYLQDHHLVDVLEEVCERTDFVSFPIEEMIQQLRQLQPRLYSISSSPLAHPTNVSITVAVVQYEQELSAAGPTKRVKRKGVCSNFLRDNIKMGDKCYVYIHRNPDFRLPASLDTPIIMVGPGTGLAPFRAFLQHRNILRTAVHGLHGAEQSTEVPGQKNQLLFFGCRRKDSDFLYRKELEEWSAQGDVALYTAFSRDEGPKTYVQNRMRESEVQTKIWELLTQGGHFYVCGDALHMAGDVEQALLETIQKHSQSSDVGLARSYLDELASSQRYQRDVWF